MFFAISSFLITKQYVKEKPGGKKDETGKDSAEKKPEDKGGK